MNTTTCANTLPLALTAPPESRTPVHEEQDSRHASQRGEEIPATWKVALALGAVYVLWGSTYIAIRFAIDGLPPFLMSGARHATAGLLLYAWMRRKGAPAPTRTQWSAAAIVGALLLVGGNGLLVWAETRIPSGLASVVVATVPLWMIFLDWVRPSGVRPHGRVLWGLLIGFLGTCLLAGPMDIVGARPPDPLGVAVVLLASLSWAAGSIYARTAALPRTPILATGMEMLSGGLLLVLVGLGSGEVAHVHLAAVSWQAWSALLYLIVFGSLIGFSAYTWLLKVAPTNVVATYAYVNPVIALGLGWGLRGEVLSLRTMVAASIVLAGVGFIVSARKASK